MKVKNITAWIITALLVFGFIFSGYLKVTGNPEMVNGFKQWGYPWFFMYVIGVAELISAVGLPFRKARPWAALTLIIIMIGAIGTHLLHDEAAWAALINLLLLIALLWLRKEEWSLHLTELAEASTDLDSA